MELEHIGADVLSRFAIYGDFENIVPFGNGHINNTFVSQWDQGGTKIHYTHQKINDRVFPRPDHIMENIMRVTGHLAEKYKDAPNRGSRSLTVIPAKDGKPYVRDSAGGWWRTYIFIENVYTVEVARSPDETRFLGSCIGRFQKQLADLSGPRLNETIPRFHDMRARYRAFYEAVRKDSAGRAAEAAAEIAFMEQNEERGMSLISALEAGRIPERICHNDTKMNNILIGSADKTVVCVIDLDTVMPGTSLFDLGDLVRTGTNRAAEDEPDTAKVIFDAAFYRALIEGYMSEADSFFTEGERSLLPEAGRYMTQIVALRFLTDYLAGDQYFHITRPEHNLDRCRNQIALIRSMDSEWETVSAICGRWKKHRGEV
jgi:Ser/Thr protein kinase RdoA (MazF antagonist)